MAKSATKGLLRKPAKKEGVAKQPLPSPVPVSIVPAVRSIVVELPPMIADRLESMAKERGTDISTMVRVSLHNLARRSNYYDLNTKLGFGKYGEEIMEAVIRCDPGYISWCLRELEKFTLSADCLALMERIENGTEGEPEGAPF